MQIRGSLPAAPELPELYRSWQVLYKAINYYNNQSRAIEIEEVGITHFSEDEYSSICQKLEQSLNDWLSNLGFNSIEQQLRTQLNREDSIRIIIQSDNHDVWQLPWHRWQLIKEDYPQAEVALSMTEYSPPQLQSIRKKGKTKILVILGNSSGIKVKEDEKLLKRLPNVELLLLNQPQRQELNERLWEQGWDILFFAGHSQSEDDGQTGRIYINQNSEKNSLTIGELEEALKRGVAQGLQLAIFNSCDGLGLVRELNIYPSRGRTTDTRGRQILLNYRSLDSPLNIAAKVTVGEIMKDRISPSFAAQLKNRIVLIGIAAPFATSNDYWLTPESGTQSIAESKIPGVFIQAHMVSQLISAVLDKRPLLWLLPWWREVLWIGGWCLVASLVNRWGLSRIEITTLLILSFNFGFGYLLLLKAGWMPLIPSIIAINYLPFTYSRS